MKKNLALAAAMSIIATTMASPLTINAATGSVALTQSGKLDVETEYGPIYQTDYGVPSGGITPGETWQPGDFDPDKDIGGGHTLYGVNPVDPYPWKPEEPIVMLYGPYPVNGDSYTLELNEGETRSLSYILRTDYMTKPDFASADESIVKVDSDGNVTCIRAGETKVTLMYGNGITDTVHITVTAKSPDKSEPEQPAPLEINTDKDLVTLRSSSGETDESKVAVPNEKVCVVAKTFTDKKLKGFNINDKFVSSPNNYELTLPESGSVDIVPVYEDVPQNEEYYQSISTHDSENTNIAVNSDEVSLFVDSKETYGDTVLNKKENKRLYFSVNEDSAHGKIKAVRYNGQRIKPRGYFFINIDENSFDNVVIDIEYEN